MPGELIPSNPKLDAVEDVEIDDGGRFKYILCKIYEADKSDSCKLIVRGSQRAEFHSDIYDDLDALLEDHGLVCECLGGGKITHNSAESLIEVSGKSQGYGKANHAQAVDILRKKYPHYTSISYSDD